MFDLEFSNKRCKNQLEYNGKWREYDTEEQNLGDENLGLGMDVFSKPIPKPNQARQYTENYQEQIRTKRWHLSKYITGLARKSPQATVEP